MLFAGGMKKFDALVARGLEKALSEKLKAGGGYVPDGYSPAGKLRGLITQWINAPWGTGGCTVKVRTLGAGEYPDVALPDLYNKNKESPGYESRAKLIDLQLEYCKKEETEREAFLRKRAEITANTDKAEKAAISLAKDAKDLEERKQEIYKNELSSLESLVSEYGAVKENNQETYDIISDTRGKIKEIAEETGHILTLEDAQKEITEAKLEYDKEMAEISFKAANGLMEQKDEQEAVNSAAAGFNDRLTKIAGTYREADGAAEELNKLIKETIKEQEDVIDLEDVINIIKQKELDYQQQLTGLEFQSAHGMITEEEAAAERLKLTEGFNKQMSEVAAKYGDIEGAAYQAAAALKDINKETDKLSFEDNFKKVAEGLTTASDMVGDAGESVISIMDSMAKDQIAVIDNLLEEQKELIDQQYEETMARLDEERQAALEAAGFVAAATEEGRAASLEAAMASGDEELIYKEKRRQQELLINQNYDEQEKAAEKKKEDDLKKEEKKAAQDKADIEYQSAMANWTLQMLQAPAQIASALLAAYSQLGFPPSPGGIAATAIGGVLGALQIAALAAAMPKKQTVKFAQGGAFANGIYEAPTPFLFADGAEFRSGLMGEAGPEAVMPLVRDAAGALGVNAANAGGGETAVTIVLMLDGSVLSQSTVKHINNGDTVQIDGIRVS